jgi:L-threonylcarbamoyladenylate synthase
MAEVLDWQRVADPGALVHYAVGSLRQGRIVVFPTETGYVVTASALVPEAVRRLRDNGCGGSGVSPAFSELSLVVRGAAEARDWAPALSPLGQRLARRLWPGPVTLIVGGDVEHGLASRLPEEVRSSLCLDGTARLTASGHEALREVLRYLPGPLVLAAASAESRADLFITDGGRAGGGRGPEFSSGR